MTQQPASLSEKHWLVASLLSPYVCLLMMIMALWAQFPHAKFVFHKLIPLLDIGQDSDTQATFYALTMECLIAIFVIHNWHRFSYLFACVSIATNVAYYQLGGVEMFTSNTKNLWVFWLFSIILPVAIAALTHLLADSLADLSPTRKPQARDKSSLLAWLASLQHVKVGLAVEWMKSLIPQEAQAELVTVVPSPQAVQVAGDTQELPKPLPLVNDKWDEKYLPIVQVLQGNQDGLLAGQLASATGIAQSTLCRKDKGWLVDLVKQGVLATRQEGDKLFYMLRGTWS